MRIFTCNNCGQLVFFDNDRCLRCSSPLGYVHERRDVVALTEVGPGRLVELGDPVRVWQRCLSVEATACNWLVPVGRAALCASCVLTQTRPADDDPEGLGEFLAAEMAKRRLVFQLAELDLPLQRRDEAKGIGVGFDLLSSSATKVITGHDNGIITLDLAEADDVHRGRLRLQLNEPYRTVLGHFRHEIGHYYWAILVDQAELLEACRVLFGDDREDYAAAVERHYDDGAEVGDAWSDGFISRYATMHPYEDWAETFAHYLHILDTLQTAESFGVGITAPGGTQVTLRPGAEPTRPGSATSFGQVIDQWLTLSYALNQINRSMGSRDLYPFVLSAPVVRKLAFVDQVVRHRRAQPAGS